MNRIEIRLHQDATACPKCANTRIFHAYSEQVAEDNCEVWVQCRCGFDPTAEKKGERLEDAMGYLDRDNINTALAIWCQLLEPQQASAT